MGVSRKQSTPKFSEKRSSDLLIRTRTSAYQGVRNVRLLQIWRALFSGKTRFGMHTLASLPTNSSNVVTMKLKKNYSVSPSVRLNYDTGTMLIITRVSTSVYVASILLLVVQDYVSDRLFLKALELRLL